jgi:hypothetical protein
MFWIRQKYYRLTVLESIAMHGEMEQKKNEGVQNYRDILDPRFRITYYVFDHETYTHFFGDGFTPVQKSKNSISRQSA